MKSNHAVKAVWGDPFKGGTDPNIKSDNYGVKAAWGDPSQGGTDPNITSGIVNVFSNEYAFAAPKKSDGSVKSMGKCILWWY